MDELGGFLVALFAILIAIGLAAMAAWWVAVNIVWPILKIVLIVAMWVGGSLLSIGLAILLAITIAGIVSALAVGLKRTGDLIREANVTVPR